MLQPKSLCHMNVIPPYGRPALIPLVTSMDDSEKEFTSTMINYVIVHWFIGTHIIVVLIYKYCEENYYNYKHKLLLLFVLLLLFFIIILLLLIAVQLGFCQFSLCH